ncbi:hypothetical protein Rumeso_03296 [Rubellimicrobium mesophilum DSM 19309]|uniref:Uncharacterized protein n=1 Tax=Rubellimicrobium mesophilum DSM 19309 TaxID=442562 RepID=A0A017HLK3_9RHOB|nr:hypothetical protein [Rubellimicrobium mesophilum]EYD75200.1 hypothetical protein Rumeso_03296 [Rubellimicrobium mesophilum DSM 19309]
MKKVWSIISGIVVAVAGGLKVVSAFTGNEVACDSDTARQLVQQIGQDNIRNDAASAEAFSADRSTFVLSDIKQDAETEGGVRCSATLTAQLDWSDALAGMKTQDAAGFEAALAEKGLAETMVEPNLTSVSYTVEEAEGNMVQVEVSAQAPQAKNN